MLHPIDSPTIQMVVSYPPSGYAAYCEAYDIHATGWTLDVLRQNAADAANRKVRYYLRKIEADDIAFVLGTV